MFNRIQEIDSSELAGWVGDESHQLRVIDVREMSEIAQGTLPKAEPLPLATLPSRPGDFEPDEKPVIICRSGAGLAQVCLFFQQQGFNNGFNLRGGMIAWVHNTLPVVRSEVEAVR